MDEIKLDSFVIMNLPIGSKKRLEEMGKENFKLNMEDIIFEFQNFYDRFLEDLKDKPAWNNISIEMMLYNNSNIKRC